MIASKQDNINALNIFSSSNLLPDEIKFANGLIESYEIVQQHTLSKDDFDADVREWILDTLDADSKDYDNFAYNSKIDEDDAFLKDYLFSVESLKKSIGINNGSVKVEPNKQVIVCKYYIMKGFL